MSNPVTRGGPDLGALWEERGWHYRRSLASRVTLLTTMAVGLTVAVMALGAYVTVRMQLQASTDASLLDRTAAVARTASDAEVTGRDYTVPGWLLGASDVRLFLVTADGGVYTVDGGKSLKLGEPEFGVAARHEPSSLRTIVSNGEKLRVAAWPAGDHSGQAVVLVQSLAPQERVLGRLGLVMLLFGGAGIIAAALTGWVVARNGLRPVRRLTHAVEEIARTEDLTPLTVEGDDEVARLSMAFNSMLTALSASRDRQKQLVADAGHELRTPLTSLRTNLDLLSQADSPDSPMVLPADARAEIRDDVRGQLEELTTLIGDLVELARDDPPALVVQSLDLAEVVERSVARVRRRAPGLEWVVDLQPWEVTGEDAALERAVTNLLDNAAKWSPAGGTVVVRLAGGVLTVDDEGGGIAEADREHIFERFYRSPESRSMPGSGLGLSIVRQVLERHSGTVEATEAPGGGARLVMWIPPSVTRLPDPTPPSGRTPPGRAPSGRGQSGRARP